MIFQDICQIIRAILLVKIDENVASDMLLVFSDCLNQGPNLELTDWLV